MKLLSFAGSLSAGSYLLTPFSLCTISPACSGFLTFSTREPWILPTGWSALAHIVTSYHALSTLHLLALPQELSSLWWLLGFPHAPLCSVGGNLFKYPHYVIIRHCFKAPFRTHVFPGLYPSQMQSVFYRKRSVNCCSTLPPAGHCQLAFVLILHSCQVTDT